MLDQAMPKAPSVGICVCSPALLCVCYLQLDLLDLRISPAVSAVVQVCSTEFLCVELAIIGGNLVVQMSLDEIVVIIQLDRISHWLT